MDSAILLSIANGHSPYLQGVPTEKVKSEINDLCAAGFVEMRDGEPVLTAAGRRYCRIYMKLEENETKRS